MKNQGIFKRFDRNRDGSIDSQELAQALASLAYKVSPQVINLLISKFTTSAGGRCSLQYDNFIEYVSIPFFYYLISFRKVVKN